MAAIRAAHKRMHVLLLDGRFDRWESRKIHYYDCVERLCVRSVPCDSKRLSYLRLQLFVCDGFVLFMEAVMNYFYNTHYFASSRRIFAVRPHRIGTVQRCSAVVAR